ncbi:alcohol dehydrogenase [Metarhizium robertsii ARSEF 23]|uniref:Alcohol dehydrogenase n=1 Tax=Metarhizium robertsii (strain ARSEF 23 / ATCC MYA-3075) TaxID=655844 RepID=E9EWL2_METRA|nr:alcohol dehydrogenase [Metarhizium robertsii ARSEF 23]EFZ00634.2 alcohol dehydrogenase [Metarhizium robertsii ARSEF 23]
MHNDVLLALEVAARRRHRSTLARDKAQKHVLNAHAYHRMQKQLNKTTFLAPIDADTTKANIYYIKKKFARFCDEKQHGSWKKAISWKYCDKGFIMVFLFWICETYLQRRRKVSKRKTVNQYWRDLKMLYRRSNNGKEINANDCEEYINRKLTEKFKLDNQPGSKPVLGANDLLLGLTHHWCRDKSVFPTEDDRLDLSTIMLFQSYTACRPAELVDGTKSRGKGDPMLDESDDEDPEIMQPIEDEPESSDDDSDLGSSQSIFDESDDWDSDSTSDAEYYDTQQDENEHNNDPSSKRIEIVEVDSIFPSKGISGIEEDSELVREHKVLCYEDIVLWIVQDPNHGGRDVLAIEVFLLYHKGADRKPKPYIDPLYCALY